MHHARAPGVVPAGAQNIDRRQGPALMRLSEKLICPSCGSKNDGATGFADSEGKTPVNGDLSVCYYCGAILQYSNDLTELRLVSASELAAMDDEQPGLADQMNRAREIVKQLNKEDRTGE